MKNALVCLEQLGIGGVETFTLTQVNEFNRRGIKCYILSRDGILREKLKGKKNIEWIEFDFKLQDTAVDWEEILKLERIILSKKIDFIYVHQFPCIPYILPIALRNNIRYVAYLHNMIPGSCEWFMAHYRIFLTLFPIYFQCASKIIAITKNVKEEHQYLFELPDSKYMVVSNSLDFSDYKDKKVKTINMKFDNLLWFGRVCEHKRESIYTAVKIFKHIKETHNKDVRLTILGDGEILSEIKEMFKEENIEFIGAVSNVKPYIEKADILLGVDRCALESVASKKPTIISGYKGNMIFVTPENIKKIVEENFSGINVDSNENELFKYSEQELVEIVEENYKYIKENLSIENSIFLDIPEMTKDDLNPIGIIDSANAYIKQIKKLEQENKALYEDNQRLYKELELNIPKKVNRKLDRITKKIRRVK